MKQAINDALTIDAVVKEAHRNARDHGFWDVPRAIRIAELPEINIGERIALIHSEVSEAFEEYRIVGEDIEKLRAFDTSATGKPIGFAQEADIVIRVADLCGRIGIDLEAALNLKMAYNRTRPHKHGKVC